MSKERKISVDCDSSLPFEELKTRESEILNGYENACVSLLNGLEWIRKYYFDHMLSKEFKKFICNNCNCKNNKTLNLNHESENNDLEIENCECYDTMEINMEESNIPGLVETKSTRQVIHEDGTIHETDKISQTYIRRYSMNSIFDPCPFPITNKLREINRSFDDLREKNLIFKGLTVGTATDLINRNKIHDINELNILIHQTDVLTNFSISIKDLICDINHKIIDVKQKSVNIKSTLALSRIEDSLVHEIKHEIEHILDMYISNLEHKRMNIKLMTAFMVKQLSHYNQGDYGRKHRGGHPSGYM